MNTSRRGFLAQVAAGIVGVAVDPELLAWEPGARTFFDLHQSDSLGISIRMFRHYAALEGQPKRSDALYGWSKMNWPMAVTLASEGIVLTETMPRAEFKRRYGYEPPPSIDADDMVWTAPKWL